jgi:ferric-dicitrate binding protein FerR (iron transport regulator)
MMEDGKDFKVLFKKWQEQKLTPAESQRLMRLINSGAYHDALAKLLSEFHESDVDDAVVNAADLQETYAQLMAKIHKSAGITPQPANVRRLTPMRVAAIGASFFIAFASAVFVYRAVVLPNASGISSLTSFNDKQYFRLPDGTAVMLNDNSTLTYDQDFGNELREVTLTGEAFFDVAHIPNRPFIVRTHKINTIALGTAFNINSFKTKVVVTVVRGKVKVGSKDEVFGLLTSNEEITVDSRTMKFSKININSDEAVTWNKSFIIMNDVTMKEAALIISKKFTVNVTIASDDLAKCRIKTSFVNDETLEEVLQLISFSINGSFSRKGETYVITGKC